MVMSAPAVLAVALLATTAVCGAVEVDKWCGPGGALAAAPFTAFTFNVTIPSSNEGGDPTSYPKRWGFDLCSATRRVAPGARECGAGFLKAWPTYTWPFCDTISNPVFDNQTAPWHRVVPVNTDDTPYVFASFFASAQSGPVRANVRLYCGNETALAPRASSEFGGWLYEGYSVFAISLVSSIACVH
jgi:hypothetical protein